MKSTAGVGKITNKRTSKSHHAPSFTYAIYNRQALDLLTFIFPFLKTYKRERTALILESYIDLTPRNGKYSKELLAKKIAFEKEVLNLKANST